ncbi:MAG: hypothetical protein WBA11_10620, partial [Rubrivirga sp.]
MIRGLFVMALAVWATAAGAQERPSLRQDSIPPLPDSLRLYGGTLATRPPLPVLDAAGEARRLTLDHAIEIALLQNPDRRISALEGLRAANDVSLGNAGYLPTLNATANLAGLRSDG